MVCKALDLTLILRRIVVDGVIGDDGARADGRDADGRVLDGCEPLLQLTLSRRLKVRDDHCGVVCIDRDGARC